DYLRDIEPTPDGGYVLAGFNYNFPQSSWVVKVDSLGNTCGVADCDNYVEPIGVAAVEMERVFSVYPNPSTGQVQIQTQWHEPLQLSIIDVLGRTVYAQTIQPYNNTIVNTLSEGLYVCKLYNSQQQLIATQKLIVIE
ncbi:MAG TPA: T9SS type A sorting domain-containing protein, partial [Chitinophagales bacterium]|nr:T9SS type A sorting domain-containing protein [Chitinophagales bacterium]